MPQKAAARKRADRRFAPVAIRIPAAPWMVVSLKKGK